MFHKLQVEAYDTQRRGLKKGDPLVVVDFVVSRGSGMNATCHWFSIEFNSHRGCAQNATNMVPNSRVILPCSWTKSTLADGRSAVRRDGGLGDCSP